MNSPLTSLGPGRIEKRPPKRLGCRQKLPLRFRVRGGARRAEPAIVVVCLLPPGFSLSPRRLLFAWSRTRPDLTSSCRLPPHLIRRRRRIFELRAPRETPRHRLLACSARHASPGRSHLPPAELDQLPSRLPDPTLRAPECIRSYGTYLPTLAAAQVPPCIFCPLCDPELDRIRPPVPVLLAPPSRIPPCRPPSPPSPRGGRAPRPSSRRPARTTPRSSPAAPSRHIKTPTPARQGTSRPLWAPLPTENPSGHTFTAP